MRTPFRKTKSKKAVNTFLNDIPKNLMWLIATTTKLWCKHHLIYDQARYVAKEVRNALEIKRVKNGERVVQRLSLEEGRGLIQ